MAPPAEFSYGPTDADADARYAARDHHGVQFPQSQLDQWKSVLPGPRIIHTYTSRDDPNANRPQLDLLDRFHVCRQAASAKHENFVMSTSHTARSGRRQTTRSTLLT